MAGSVVVVSLEIVKLLLSQIHEREMPVQEFRRKTARLSTILWEVVLSSEHGNYLRKEKVIEGHKYHELSLKPNTYVVATVLRAAESMITPNILFEEDFTFIKLLVRRAKGEDYTVFEFAPPGNLSSKIIFLADNMLATGGALLRSIELLLSYGAKEKNIRVVTIFSSQRGIDVIRSKYPKMNIFTCGPGQQLNDKNYLVPGAGDYGDRYFNTVHS